MWQEKMSAPKILPIRLPLLSEIFWFTNPWKIFKFHGCQNLCHRNFGVTCHTVAFDASKRASSMIRSVVMVWALLRRVRPDVVQAHLFDDAVPVLVAAWLARDAQFAQCRAGPVSFPGTEHQPLHVRPKIDPVPTDLLGGDRSDSVHLSRVRGRTV